MKASYNIFYGMEAINVSIIKFAIHITGKYFVTVTKIWHSNSTEVPFMNIAVSVGEVIILIQF